MSLPWRDEARVGLCPGRLVVARRPRGIRGAIARSIVPATADLAADLRVAADGADLTIVLSSHFVRHTVLPWSESLRNDAEWLAFAQHEFTATYGLTAASWQVRVARAGRREPRVASAIDGELLETLRGIPGVVSIQPYFMVAFNVRRHALTGASAWFVLQEPGRLTLGLVQDGLWALARTRQAHREWRESLAPLLEREAAAAGAAACGRVVMCCEDEAPGQAGRFRIEDLTLVPGTAASLRPHAMTLH